MLDVMYYSTQSLMTKRIDVLKVVEAELPEDPEPVVNVAVSAEVEIEEAVDVLEVVDAELPEKSEEVDEGATVELSVEVVDGLKIDEVELPEESEEVTDTVTSVEVGIEEEVDESAEDELDDDTQTSPKN
ncbi:hypothetical protein BX600DRAFT_437083 [Xylariales sp. PMI_506]|nr:hypothetical protein BX600DRAFT_437083 [Xylariales sp. PMI_506]